MLSLLGRPQLNKPIVFGGNLNSVLVTWMKQLGVDDFLHGCFNIRSINPTDIQLSAEHLRKMYGDAEYLFSVGKIAHKTLVAAGLDHGALPSTSTKDKKEIEAAMVHCRNYLIRRFYYAPKGSSPLSSG